MIDWMVNLDTSPDGAMREAVAELRKVAEELRVDLDKVTGNVSSQAVALEKIQNASATPKAPAKAATSKRRRSTQKAGE